MPSHSRSICLQKNERLGCARSGSLSTSQEALPEARIYLDASLWVSTWVMADLLHRANMGTCPSGFSLNVAGHADDGSVTEYGDTLLVMTGGKQYVVDTSRNGAASANDEEWCNARGLGLGRRPGTLVARGARRAGLDRSPVSDGTCNGGPARRTFWLELACDAAP